MDTTSVIVATFASVVLVLSLPACMSSPRNGQRIDDYTIDFQGYMTSTESVELHQWNWVEQRWTDVGQNAFPREDDFVDDPSGARWYSFVSTPAISNQRSLWQSAGSDGDQRLIATRLKGRGQESGGDLASFDMNANECAMNQASGWDVINNCASSNSPGAEIFLPCGKPDQVCCSAHDIPDGQVCDDGRVCTGVNGRCSVESGGLDQPCGGDGACGRGLVCVSGSCRNNKAEILPIITLDLRIHSCAEPDQTLFVDNSQLFVNLGTGDFTIEVPGADVQAGQTTTLGLRPAGIKTVGDITRFDIRLHNGLVCYESLELLANGNVLFRKEGRTVMRGGFPQGDATQSIDLATLREFWTQPNHANAVCVVPSRIPGDALERTITAAVGEALVRLGDDSDELGAVGFDPHGSASLHPVSDETTRYEARFDARVDAVGPFDLTVDVAFNQTLRCEDGNVSIELSPIEILDISGDPGFTVLNLFTIGLLELVLESVAGDEANQALSSFAGALKNVANTSICLPLMFDRATPPNLVVSQGTGGDLCEVLRALEALGAG